jgi:hypothetical protein
VSGEPGDTQSEDTEAENRIAFGDSHQKKHSYPGQGETPCPFFDKQGSPESGAPRQKQGQEHERLHNNLQFNMFLTNIQTS